MAIAKSSKKERSRRREPKRPEWSQGGPKRKRKTLVALQKNVGWADTQIEVGGARDESSCGRVGSVGEHLFLGGLWCLFSNKQVQDSQSLVEKFRIISPLRFWIGWDSMLLFSLLLAQVLLQAIWLWTHQTPGLFHHKLGIGSLLVGYAPSILLLDPQYPIHMTIDSIDKYLQIVYTIYDDMTTKRRSKSTLICGRSLPVRQLLVWNPNYNPHLMHPHCLSVLKSCHIYICGYIIIIVNTSVLLLCMYKEFMMDCTCS